MHFAFQPGRLCLSNDVNITPVGEDLRCLCAIESNRNRNGDKLLAIPNITPLAEERPEHRQLQRCLQAVTCSPVQ